jgi:hypothetical protein
VGRNAARLAVPSLPESQHDIAGDGPRYARGSGVDSFPLFRDRSDAGQRLAARLIRYIDKPNLLVLGLPRGGVPVAAEVARALHAPLDVFVVRKLGVPGQEELAMGALASGGMRVLNEEVIQLAGISEETVDAVSRLSSSAASGCIAEIGPSRMYAVG